MNFLRKLVVKHPLLTIIISIILSISLGLGILKVKIKDDVVEMLPKKMASRQALQEMENTFGASDFIGITIGKNDGNVFNTTTLQKLKKITDKLEQIPYVERAKSLSNATRIIGTEQGMEILPVMESVPATKRGLLELEKLVMKEKDLVGSYVSDDKKYLSIFVFLIYSHVDSSVIYNVVKDIAIAEKGTEDIRINGVPVIAGIIGKSIRKDLMVLIPIVIVVLIVILYLGLKTKRGVALTLLVVILSVLPPIGLMGYLNKPLMVVTSSMPIILLALSCAYSIHVIMKYYTHVSSKKTKRQAVVQSMDELFVPIAGSALTTMFGFLSMATSPLPILRELGIFAALGIFWAWALSLTLLPALLFLLPVPKHIELKETQHRGVFHGVSDVLADFTVKYKYLVIMGFTAITVFFIVGISKLRIESSIDRFFDKNSEVRLANKISNEHFGGSANLSIILKGDILDPDILNNMLSLQAYLKEIKGIGSAISIADIVSSINMAVHHNNPKFKKIPETAEAVSQALLLYSMSGDPGDLKMFINSDYTQAHISVRMASMYSKDVKDILQKIKLFMPKHFPPGVTYSVTGSSIFTKELSEMTAISSIWSIITSLIAIIIIAAILFRSIQLGLLSTIPLSVTILLIFGFMGFVGIDFSIEIAIISSIVIGTGVDYAIHYIAGYCLVSKSGSLDEITKNAIQTVGPRVLSNATSISLGFLVLLLSFLVPLKSLGLLVSISLMLSALLALTMLSAILSIYKPKLEHRILVFDDGEF